jgi:catechol 2,3-dioxygenase-like lactoylglutathione lyase family enzyme
MDKTEQFWRSQAIERDLASISTQSTTERRTPMFNAINISHIFVFDQEKALDFYVGKLGLEVSNDMNLGFMRWLTVRVPGDPSRDVLLELPAPPGMDEKTAAQVRETISKGGSGFALGLTTSDCRKTYETLKARGVEFSEEPTEHPYGIDCGLRDPFGNHLRIVQLATAPQQVPARKS